MSWTPEKEEKLKKLWTSGHSGSEIANILRNTTRNAVIGKAHRLNLQARAVSRKKQLKINNNNKKDEKSSSTVKIQKLGRKAKFQALLLDKNFIFIFLGNIFLAKLKCCFANISVGAIKAT